MFISITFTETSIDETNEFTFCNTLLYRYAIKYQHAILHNFISTLCIKFELICNFAFLSY